MVTTLNKVEYVSQDFSSIVSDVQNFLNTTYPDEYNDYVASNLGQALIDIIAYSEQNLHWYLNRRVTDLYFPTAITPNAVSKLARMLGYKPTGASASIAVITTTLDDGPYTFPVIINTGFQFQGPNNLIFEYRGDTPVIYNPGEVSKTFEVKEGSTRILNFISNGETNQVFDLVGVDTDKFIEDGSVKVTINGIEWTEYPILPYQLVNGFEVNLLSSPPRLKFGDAIQGVIPTNGASIQVSFAITSGFKGRVLKDSITDVVNNLTAQFNNIAVTISQPSNSVGGDDPEDLRSITANAPVFQRTQDRAITKSDYDFITNNFPNVARGDAMTIRGVSGDLTFMALFDAINNELNSVLELGQSATGYQTVSGNVATISGLDISISGYATNINTNYNNVSGLIDLNRTSISGYHDSINTEVLNLTSVTGSCPSISGTLISIVNSINASLNGIQVSLGNINTINGSASGFQPFPAWLLGINQDLLNINLQLDLINEKASDISGFVQVSGYSLNASGYLQNIYDYLDDTFSDGCKSNTVQVAVLGKDAGRKYVDPAPSTITTLQTYLDARKDVTHNVVVLSGTPRIIGAKIRVELNLTDTANDDSVIQRVKDTLDRSTTTPYGILIEREFNKSLYLDEIYRAIQDNLSDFEVNYFNVIIEGPTEFLDERGNLLCPNGFVIQADTINVIKI